jgi:uncharacterized protein
VPLIDSHVHVFPDRLALAVRAALEERGELTAGPLVGDVSDGVRESGFDYGWALPYAHRPGVSASVNEWSASVAAGFPNLVAGATFHPGDNDFEELVTRALVQLRLRVVKLHCSVGQFSPADERLTPLWRCVSETGAPVVVHAGQWAQGVTEVEEMAMLGPVLKRWPDARIVVAHTGFPVTDAALALMETFDNLYGDLTPVWERPQTVPVAALEHFAGRLLFGSDAPNNPVPADELARRLREMKLSDRAADELFGEAAARLIPV